MSGPPAALYSAMSLTAGLGYRAKSAAHSARDCSSVDMTLMIHLDIPEY